MEKLIQDLKTLYWANDKLLKDNKELITMNLELIEQAKENTKKDDAFIQTLEDIQKVIEREKLNHLFEDIKLQL
jgi:transcriptional regulator of aromatic amino acid metabolism